MRSAIASSATSVTTSPLVARLEELVKRVLIEGSDHRLSDVREEVIDAEASSRKRIHPIVDEQAADDESQKELGHLAGADGMRMES